MTPQDDKPKQAREWRAEDLGYDGWYIVDGHGNHPKNPSLFVESAAYEQAIKERDQARAEAIEQRQHCVAEHNEVLALKAEVERLNGRLTNVSRQYAESHQAYLDSVEDGAKDLKDMRKFQMRFIAADRLLKLAEKALEHYGSKLASTGQIAREALAKIRQAKG